MLYDDGSKQAESANSSSSQALATNVLNDFNNQGLNHEVNDIVSIAAAAVDAQHQIDPSIALDPASVLQNNQLSRPNEEVDEEEDGASPSSSSQPPPDPKKACQFCGKVFAHPGSLGRHLDMKKGNKQHPANQVAQLRADVKRRGDIHEIKARRAKRAKAYNSREDVKQRAKIRRKAKERSDRAREIAKSSFIKRIGVPSLSPHPTFAYVVLYFLPPSEWPHDPPTQQTFESLHRTIEKLNVNQKEYQSFMNRIEVAYDQWSRMDKQTKINTWVREQRRVAEAALGTVSLYDLGSREWWIEQEQARIMRDLDSEQQQDDDDEEEEEQS